MTLFEYLSVFGAIVLSFGVIRLLQGLQYALDSGRRYWVHVVWLICVLWTHPLYWWNHWSFHDLVSWTYPKFMLSLGTPAILYSMAIALIPRAPAEVESWRDHFLSVRRRFFLLFACFFVMVGLMSIFVLEQPFFHPLRVVQLSGIAIFVSVSGLRGERLQGVLAILMLAMMTWTLFLFAPEAPLNQVGN